MNKWKGPLFSEVTTTRDREANKLSISVKSPSVLTGAALHHRRTLNQVTFLALEEMGIGDNGYYPIAWVIKNDNLLTLPMSDYKFTRDDFNKAFEQLLKKTVYPANDLIPCPRCHGSGVTWGLGNLLKEAPQPICSLCSGSGEVATGLLLGQQARSDRGVVGVITRWNGAKFRWEGTTATGTFWSSKAPIPLGDPYTLEGEEGLEEEWDDEEDEE